MGGKEQIKVGAIREISNAQRTPRTLETPSRHGSGGALNNRCYIFVGTGDYICAIYIYDECSASSNPPVLSCVDSMLVITSGLARNLATAGGSSKNLKTGG